MNPRPPGGQPSLFVAERFHFHGRSGDGGELSPALADAIAKNNCMIANPNFAFIFPCQPCRQKSFPQSSHVNQNPKTARR
jgi:hypothetical protein